SNIDPYFGSAIPVSFYLYGSATYGADQNSGDYTLGGLPTGSTVSAVNVPCNQTTYWYVQTTIPANTSWIPVSILARQDNVLENSESIIVTEKPCPYSGMPFYIANNGGSQP